MAKFDLKFIDALDDDSFIKCNVAKSQDPDKWIEIRSFYDEHETIIWLDKSTAIKFAKTLRTEINKIKDEDNG